MFAVTQQQGTNTDHRHYLEYATEYPDDSTIDPATVVVMHRTREGAYAAAVRIARDMGMPEDSYPELWGNIAVHTIYRWPLYYVIRD
jgi:hypothetical protein